MAKIAQYGQKRIVNIFNNLLFSRFANGEISEDYIDAVIDDLDLLIAITNTSFWQSFLFYKSRFDMTIEREIEFFNNSISKYLSSDVTRAWVQFIIEQGNLKILNKIVNDSEKFIVRFYLEMPEYVNFSDEEKLRLKKSIRDYHNKSAAFDNRIKFVKVNFLLKPISEENQHLKDDKRFISILSDLFRYQIELLEKKLLTS